MYAWPLLQSAHCKRGIMRFLKIRMLVPSGSRCQAATRQLHSSILFSKPQSVTKQLPKCLSLPYTKRLPLATCLGSWRTYSSSDEKSDLDSSVATKEETAKAVVPKLSEMTRLMSLAKPEASRLGVAIALLAFSSGVTMLVPFALGKVIDVIYSGSYDSLGSGVMMTNLTYLCGVLSAVFLLGAGANFGRVYLMYTSGERVIKRLRESIFNSIMKQEIAFFDKTRTGELVNRLSTDTTVIGNAVTTNISDGLRALAQAIGGVGMMFYTSVKLATIVISIVPPVAVIAVVYGRFLRSISKQVQDALAKSTEVAEEKISSVRTVRAFAQENREKRAYSSSVQHVLDLATKESLLWGAFYAAMGLSSNLIILAVLYNGGAMMTDAQITVGSLSAFLLYAAYVGISVGGISSFYSEMMKGLGASTRLWEILDRTPTIPLTDGLVPNTSALQGHIDFKNLHFAYPLRIDQPIFKELSLTVPAGSVTAVVGSSGSGKSTLGSLLLRYYDADQGQILLDGTDVRTLSPEWLRCQIGTVSQEPILFSTTIGENIAYGANNPESVTSEELVAAARTANALGFIQAFPDKFDTLVGERGLMLSGGQKQRIALARAILKNPKILILDEATSALDAESEYLVQEALQRLMVGRTVITIAHRLSTIKRADNIAVLDKGSVVELGSYEELMRVEDGVFRKLVERQTVMN
ncbi:ATP-binding cassette sub-family B member 10, mitochondrial-like [Patiria miniata]|uniref:ATP-binding cassette sub-family B member 10, mitochondrial n=1 Tax=Patiria miniata TaxID=46514 RepID=A0A914BDE6_PATMI|nr:ATP-binding cassette sub-family B member 10, mitochondrial-like [Patiria miniata]